MTQIAQLVIFDCDGVLVDTERLANELMAEFFKDYGLNVTGEESRRLFQGGTLEDVASKVCQMTGRPDDPDMAPKLRIEIEACLAQGVQPIEGAVELVNHMIARDTPVCVASSGSISKMHSTLGQVGLLPQLKNYLFSAQDEGRSKPHPDVFLRAARTMGIDCNHSIIIEDSLTGVKAGVASGAKVFGYAGDPFTDAKALKAAGAIVFSDMAELPALAGLE